MAGSHEGFACETTPWLVLA